VAEQLHQGVDADLGVGELGGEGVAQPVDKGAAGARSASMPARRNARSTRYCRVPRALARRTHEQRGRRRPGGQSPAGGGAPLGGGGEAGGPGVEIALEHLDQRRLDGDPTVFAAFATDVDDGAVVGAAEITDVGAQQFIGAQPGQQRGQD
jgi:hypothetical protein